MFFVRVAAEGLEPEILLGKPIFNRLSLPVSPHRHLSKNCTRQVSNLHGLAILLEVQVRHV